MKAFFLLPVLAALLALSGCAVLEKPEMDAVRRSGVEPYLVDKMRHAEPLGPGEIIALSRARVGDDILLRYISRTGIRFALTKETSARMRRAGVSTRVLRAVAYESHLYITDYAASRAIIAADYLDPYPYPFFYGGGEYYHGSHHEGHHEGHSHGHGHHHH